MIRTEKICSSRTVSTLFYAKRSRVSRIRAITDTDTGEEKRTGVVPTLEEEGAMRKPCEFRLCSKSKYFSFHQSHIHGIIMNPFDEWEILLPEQIQICQPQILVKSHSALI